MVEFCFYFWSLDGAFSANFFKAHQYHHFSFMWKKTVFTFDHQMVLVVLILFNCNLSILSVRDQPQKLKEKVLHIVQYMVSKILKVIQYCNVNNFVRFGIKAWQFLIYGRIASEYQNLTKIIIHVIKVHLKSFVMRCYYSSSERSIASQRNKQPLNKFYHSQRHLVDKI